ncbi:AAA family ATPase [Candidatus Saccharibacteria bacterium]|nr:AAA family ATPase [Candidatus Saccharibacteria bacterium]
MAKLELTKPTLIMLYGFPGAGKTYFANHIAETIRSAHVQGDKIRYQLFEEPRYDKTENEIVEHLMEYMTEEFLDSGVSVIYDTNAINKRQRRRLREIARKKKSEHVLIWFQIDADSAFARVSHRDRRRAEDRHAQPLDRPKFNEIIGKMQRPAHDEDFIVLSGKHSFPMQRTAILKKLYSLRLIDPSNLSSGVVKPGLINLVPASGRVDMSRRNITIR